MKKTGEDFLDDLVVPDFRHAHTAKVHGFEGTKILITAEPANIQAILATQFSDFELGKRRYDQFKIFVGRSIFSADGPFWEHSRAMFRPQFARDNINDLQMTDRATSVLMEALGDPDDKGWTSGEPVMPLLYNFTLDTASDFLFGESLDSQQWKLDAKRAQVERDVEKVQHQKDAQEFSESFGIMNEYIVNRIRFQTMYFLSDGPPLRRAIKKVNKFTDRYVKLAVDHHETGISKGKKDSLLDNLATQTSDKVEMRNQVTALLLAGRDTTSAALGWSFVRLALHPEIFQKLRNIILTQFPPGEELTFAKLKGCRYLQHFLQEVLRLHPTVPMNQRGAAKDTTLPTGGGADGKSPIAVPKGGVIVYSVYVMHRRKDLWGEDAAEFKPERWERRYPAWQWLPFNGGPRICLGQQFALTEASFVLVRFLQEFDKMEAMDLSSLEKLPKGLGLTMWPEDSRVRFHKAKA